MVSFNKNVNEFFSAISLILLLISVTQSIHIHHQSSHLNHAAIYNQQQYLAQLSSRQYAFKQQLQAIQNDFAGINMMLKDNDLKKNEKIIKLNEALADQREQLISAQSSLNLPYELKQCKCINLNEQSKRNIAQKLDILTSKINDLEKTQNIEQGKAKCRFGNQKECVLIQQVQKEVSQLRSYQNIMKQTITSQCCLKIDYQYKDNLNAQNWHWGGLNQSDYQAKIYSREQSAAANNTKIQPCPRNTPFVNQGSKLQKAYQSCFNCQGNTPLFNLNTRKCQKDCTETSQNGMYVLNLPSHVCSYNTTCPSGQHFQELYKKCIPTPTYYNESTCPLQKPYWNKQSLSCQRCPSEAPYFDQRIGKCRKCNQSQFWNSNLKICSNPSSNVTNCSAGHFYNSTQRKCVPLNGDTHSHCPPDQPYWNENTFSCDKCPVDKPYFDTQLVKCRQCQVGETFDSRTGQCNGAQPAQPICGENQFYNQISKSCQSKGTTSMCPRDTPFWSSEYFKCMKCPSSQPVFNQITKKCQSCPTNHQWSTQYQTCIKQCLPSQIWSQNNKKCLKKDQTCSQPKQVFSPQANNCVDINCNQSQPFWNITISKCQPCPAGKTYRYNDNSCVSDNRSGNTSVCHEDKPIWNPNLLTCQKCPAGTDYNSNTKTCYMVTGTHHMQLQKALEQTHYSSTSQLSVTDKQSNAANISHQKSHIQSLTNGEISYQQFL